MKSTIYYFLHFNPTALPVAATSISCFTDMVDGYFWSIFAHCECSLTSEGYPRGRAQWYRDDGGQIVGGPGPFLYLMYDKDSEWTIIVYLSPSSSSSSSSCYRSVLHIG